MHTGSVLCFSSTKNKVQAYQKWLIELDFENRYQELFILLGFLLSSMTKPKFTVYTNYRGWFHCLVQSLFNLHRIQTQVHRHAKTRPPDTYLTGSMNRYLISQLVFQELQEVGNISFDPISKSGYPVEGLRYFIGILVCSWRW